MEYNWKRNLTILWFTHVTVTMCFNFGLPFLPLYLQEIRPMSRETLTFYTTIVSGAPAIFMGIMAPIWGHLSDHYGKKLMILRATIAASVLVFAMGLVQTVGQLIALRVAQGLLTGTITAVLAFVASDTPEEKLSNSLGIITGGTFIGFSLGPMIGSFLAAQVGYRMSFKLGGAIMAFSAIGVIFLVKEDKSKNGKYQKKEKQKMSVAYKAVLSPLIIGLLIMIFLVKIAMMIFTPYLPIFASDFLSTDREVVLYTGFTNGVRSFVTAISSYAAGRLALKYNKNKILNIIIIFSFITCSLFAFQAISGSVFGYFKGLNSFAFFYISFYIFMGGMDPLISSISTLNVSPENRGALFGLQGSVSSLAWFFVPVLGGPLAYYFDVKIVLVIAPIALFLLFFVNKSLRKLSNRHF